MSTSRALCILVVTIGVAFAVGIPVALKADADAKQQITDVVVVNETDTTLTVIFIGENGNRGADVPPCLAVAMSMNPERDTLEVKAIGYRKDGSVAGMATHTYHLRSPKETGWWKVNQWDL